MLAAVASDVTSTPASVTIASSRTSCGCGKIVARVISGGGTGASGGGTGMRQSPGLVQRPALGQEPGVLGLAPARHVARLLRVDRQRVDIVGCYLAGEIGR
jgi:hypothetical protein